MIAVLTDGDSGLNNFINFEVGGAVGGGKKLLTILAPGLTPGDELRTPTQMLAVHAMERKEDLRSSARRIGLDHSAGAVQEIVDALTPYEVIAARYRHAKTSYKFAGPHLTELAAKIENRKRRTDGHALIWSRPVLRHS